MDIQVRTDARKPKSCMVLGDCLKMMCLRVLGCLKLESCQSIQRQGPYMYLQINSSVWSDDLLDIRTCDVDNSIFWAIPYCLYMRIRVLRHTGKSPQVKHVAERTWDNSKWDMVDIVKKSDQT